MSLKYKHTLLFVDDEVAITKALKRLFRQEKHRILTATSGSEGLEIIKNGNEQISLIVSDQRMPQMSGAEFLEKSKQIVPDAIRFLLTGYSDMDAVIDAVNRGEINRYLTKPWNDDDLILQVRQALEQVELIKDNERLKKLTEEQNRKLSEMNAGLENKVRERTLEVIRKHEALIEANKKLEEGFMDTIRLLSSLVDTINPMLGKYMRHTARLSRSVAEKLSLGEEAMNQIEIAALFHDIGLLGMPNKLLDRPEHKLKGNDFKLYSQHPVFAAISFEVNEKLAAAAEIILHHHERMDGMGYPNGLTGQAIPIGARVISPASIFSKITECWPKDPKRIVAKAADYLGRTAAVNLKVDEPQIMLDKIAKKVLLIGGQRLYDTKVVEVILEVYQEALQKKLGGTLAKRKVSDLEPGMILMQDLRIISGQLMMVKGAVMTPSSIKTIRKFSEKKMMTENISILIKDEK